MDLSSIIRVGAVDGSVIASALNDGWNNLEDAIQAAIASHASCDAVINRNVKDFIKVPMPGPHNNFKRTNPIFTGIEVHN